MLVTHPDTLLFTQPETLTEVEPDVFEWKDAAETTVRQTREDNLAEAAIANTQPHAGVYKWVPEFNIPKAY